MATAAVKVTGLRTTLAHPTTTAAVAAVLAVREARMAKISSLAVKREVAANALGSEVCTAAAVVDQAQAREVGMAHVVASVSSGVLAQTGLIAASRTPTVQKNHP